MYNINKWVIAIIVLIVIGVLVNKYVPVPGGTQESQTLSQESAVPPRIIEMTGKGFVASNIVIPVGTAIRFVNTDTAPHWPASGVHPTHEVCPGFDSFRPVAQGEFYEFIFREEEICPVHDHLNPLNPLFKGLITVQNFQ